MTDSMHDGFVGTKIGANRVEEVGDEATKSDGGCICQEQHRRGYCTEPGCPYTARPSDPTADRREIVARIKADPGDGTLHPDLAHVLARGFDTMGWDRPASAAEDMIDAIIAALDGGRDA